ncbi:SCO family protein [Massilia sp. NR 4-1]|uniref:SCO family protein n=1 Tax=Massilia sp. NR 4-1 TaxID=1678028 RepID=UPI00067B1EFE|nr:SCO family protein [Massilia sp. NR 4-1]
MHRRDFLHAASAALALGGGLGLPSLAGAFSLPGFANSLPGDSLYRLDAQLTDQDGKRFRLADMAGRHLLATMFYGDCNTACPIIIENLRQTIASLKAPSGKLGVLMVSLDSMRDAPPTLANLSRTHKLDPAIYRLAVAKDEITTRAVAAALNVKFRVLGGGDINHSNRISLLDPQGLVVAYSTALDVSPDPELLRATRKALKLT